MHCYLAWSPLLDIKTTKLVHSGLGSLTDVGPDLRVACIYIRIEGKPCTDQLADALGLPDTVQSTGEGGGAIQASASESTVIGMLAARTKALKYLRIRSPGSTDQELFAKMVFYTSDQVKSCA